MPTATAQQFEELEQQFEADAIGMWFFLLTEVLFFGGAFLGYAVYRATYPEAWAEGSHHMDVWAGTINTGVLLISSLLMALAVHAAEDEDWGVSAGFLTGTIVLAVAFLGIKAYEYYHHIEDNLLPGRNFLFEGEPSAAHELFFGFYFVMTGLHAVHVIIGIGIIGVIAVMAWKRKFAHHMAVEMIGLYWHFVDIVWVFLYPLFYLIS